MARDHWQDGSAYEGYVGRWSRRVAERFVPWVGIERGATWVDVGCGTGVLTRAIADLASPASVVGIDPSPAFLRTARASLRDSRVEFIEGSGGALPVADESCDAVVSGLVLNFIPGLESALADMRRGARREGTRAGYDWEDAAVRQRLRLCWDAAARLE